MQNYSYLLTNDTLKLNNNEFTLQTTPIRSTILPGEARNQIITIDNEPTRVCFVNNGKQQIELDYKHINLEQNDQVRIREIFQKLRLSHIEENIRETLVKIISSYHEIFNIDTDPLPCTNLTEHSMFVKTDRPINIKSYRPPECHKLEIKKQVLEMLERESSRIPTLHTTPLYG